MIKKAVTRIVKHHIDNWDPVELLALGAPDDEYEIKVEMIVNKLPSTYTEEDLAVIIQNTFKYCFSITFAFKNCLNTASNIWHDIINTKEK